MCLLRNLRGGLLSITTGNAASFYSKHHFRSLMSSPVHAPSTEQETADPMLPDAGKPTNSMVEAELRPRVGIARVFKEEDRHLPLKLVPMNDQEIVRYANDVLSEQARAGKRIRLPFSMWKMCMMRCALTYDEYIKLDPDRRDIVMAHWTAVRNHELTYEDPSTKFTVLTVTQHLLRGKCCGNNCRHCPFDHEKVPEHLRATKQWNGAFYEDSPK